MTLIYAIGIGFSIAATAILARRIGESNPGRAAHAAAQIVVLGAAVSASLGMVLAFFAADILRLMGVDEAIVALGTNFARIHARLQRDRVPDLPRQCELSRRG
jgi:Na+-driven multidrug efflux pump